jgi:hypothetical protein
VKIYKNHQNLLEFISFHGLSQGRRSPPLPLLTLADAVPTLAMRLKRGDHRLRLANPHQISEDWSHPVAGAVANRQVWAERGGPGPRNRRDVARGNPGGSRVSA